VTISNGALAFGIGSVSKYLAIDPVYQSLEFFIKLDKGYGETTLIGTLLTDVPMLIL